MKSGYHEENIMGKGGKEGREEWKKRDRDRDTDRVGRAYA